MQKMPPAYKRTLKFISCLTSHLQTKIAKYNNARYENPNPHRQKREGIAMFVEPYMLKLAAVRPTLGAELCTHLPRQNGNLPSFSLLIGMMH